MATYDKVDACDGILVAGTSLEVYSAYRFVNHAAIVNKKFSTHGEIETEEEKERRTGRGSERGRDGEEMMEKRNVSSQYENIFQYPIPIAICNMGETRAERMKLPGIEFKSESNCALLLKSVVDLL